MSTTTQIPSVCCSSGTCESPKGEYGSTAEATNSTFVSTTWSLTLGRPLRSDTLQHRSHLCLGLAHRVAKELVRPVGNSAKLVNFKTSQLGFAVFRRINEIESAVFRRNNLSRHQRLKTSEQMLGVRLDKELYTALA